MCLDKSITSYLEVHPGTLIITFHYNFVCLFIYQLKIIVSGTGDMSPDGTANNEVKYLQSQLPENNGPDDGSPKLMGDPTATSKDTMNSHGRRPG